jgi:FkbM family methyltransferase
MERRPPLTKRILSSVQHWRYKWFGRGPSPDEWEARLQRVVADTVAQSLPWIPRENAVFLDVGANVGIYTERILRERPTARAYLFEPVRSHFERCAQRFAGNPNVVVENCALGDGEGESTIWKPKHNPGGNVIDAEIVARRKSIMDFKPEPIHVRVFDAYAREKGIERVDFIKTDTEGYDYRVLRGMLPFLRRCARKPVIIAELLSRRFHPEYDAQIDVLRSLYALGYREVDLSGMQDVEDFVFIPEGRTAVP